MDIFITGATGLIGQQLLPVLSEHNLILLTRNIANSKEKLGEKYQWVSNIDDVDFNRVDVVINLAGEPIADKRWSKQQKHIICHSRWDLTQAIADKIKASSNAPSLFISGSAIGIYGRQNNREITEHCQEFSQEFTHDVCQQWEYLALEASSEKTRVCLLRTGIVLSAQGGALSKMLPAFKYGLGGPIASGEQFMSWIHIDDMVNIITHCIENKEISGAVNVTAPKALTNRCFSRILAEHLHRPCLCRVPKFALKLMLGEMSDLVVYGQNVKPTKLLKNGFEFSYTHLPAALDNLLPYD